MSNPTLGMGACPMGSSPFGFGLPASVDARPRRVLLKPDGTQGNAAALSPATGDYVLDETGQKVGADSIEQRVYLALITALGSAADQTMGATMPTGTITTDLPQRNEQAVRAALKRMTDANLISVISVTTTPFAPTGRRVQTKWRKLTTGQIVDTFT